jgi:ethanolamine utilization microcompartment shell protein EutL
MREVDANIPALVVASDGDESVIHKVSKDVAEPLRSFRAQRSVGLLPSRVGAAFPKCDEAKQDAKRDRFLGLRQSAKRCVGVLRNGEREACAATIA